MSKFTYSKNRVIIPLLLLSILSLSLATIYNWSDPPYLVSSVTLPKNLYHPPTVTDTDRQASDYWWDGTLPQKSDQQQKFFFPIPLSHPPTPTPTPPTNNKSIIFSTTTEDLDLPLSQNSTPPSSTRNQNSLRPYRVFSSFPGSNSEIFIPLQFTKNFNLYCTHRHNETDNHPQLLNKIGVLIYDYAKRYMYENSYSKIGKDALVYTDTDASKFRYTALEGWNKWITENNIQVPHWKEVEDIDPRYKTTLSS